MSHKAIAAGMIISGVVLLFLGYTSGGRITIVSLSSVIGTSNPDNAANIGLVFVIVGILIRVFGGKVEGEKS